MTITRGDQYHSMTTLPVSHALVNLRRGKLMLREDKLLKSGTLMAISEALTIALINALRLPEWQAEHLTKTQATRYRGRPRNPVFAECHPPIVSSVKYTL